MLIGAAALAGAGLARFWLLADLASAWPPGSGGSTVGVPGPGGAGAAARSAAGRTVRLLALGGLVVLVAGSLADLRAPLRAIFPTADWSWTWRYALTSGHGAAVQVRVALALALASA